VLVSEAVGRALARLGVRHVFGLIGSGNFHVTNALVAAGAQFVASRHEGGAITMADSYARVTRRVGVCSVHQGPGLTNTTTGLAEAAKSRTPLLVLAGDTAAAALRSNFRIDQAGLATSVGAAVERLHGPATALADVARAYRRARVERRPVVLLMPLDVQAAEVPDPAPVPIPLVGTVADEAVAAALQRLPVPPLLRPVRPAAGAIGQAADVLAGARRPLIVAGRGAVLADAGPALERLGDILGALVTTSAVANGFFATNPWSLGISGGFASPLAAELIADADVVLAFGATLNMWTTRHGRLLAPDATVIQVDADPDAIGAHHRVDVAVLGDAGAAAESLVEELERRGVAPSGWRTPELAARISDGAWANVPFEDAADAAHVDPRALSRTLDAMLPLERTVAIDSGHFMGYPAMYLRVPDAAGFVFTQGFQAVGLGLASAIGAAVARPDRLTVAALGDGGALMSLAELETVARLGLRMLIVVYDDAAYGAEVHHFGPHGHPLDLVRFPEADLAALARAAGLAGATVRSLADVAAVESWLRAPSSPAMLVDAKVVPTVVAEWLEEAFRGH
jgi:thiamine pyrophosphate-dependent acetolactate synthase large subunit-like protein